MTNDCRNVTDIRARKNLLAYNILQCLAGCLFPFFTMAPGVPSNRISSADAAYRWTAWPQMPPRRPMRSLSKSRQATGRCTFDLILLACWPALLLRCLQIVLQPDIWVQMSMSMSMSMCVCVSVCVCVSEGW